MINHRFGGLPILAVTLLMLLSAAFAGGLVWYWQTQIPVLTTAETTASDQLQAEILSLRNQIDSLQKDVQYENDTAVPTTPQSDGMTTTGTIEGKVSFPSESIPQDMVVCATLVATQQETCTQVKATTSYSLKVPAGTYRVFARAASFSPTYKAYYSEFVTCGLRAECLSHQPIDIKVAAGSLSTGIDPQDWYNLAN